MTDKSQKPPTQGVGVSGFRADVYASDDQDDQKVDYKWGILINLPPFQMYAIEVNKGDIGTVMEWIKGFVQDQVREIGEKTLFDNFSDWHTRKGYWKNEDVYGNLLDK